MKRCFEITCGSNVAGWCQHDGECPVVGVDLARVAELEKLHAEVLEASCKNRAMLCGKLNQRDKRIAELEAALENSRVISTHKVDELVADVERLECLLTRYHNDQEKLLLRNEELENKIALWIDECGKQDAKLTTLRDAVRGVMPILDYAKHATITSNGEPTPMINAEECDAIERLRKEMGQP